VTGLARGKVTSASIDMENKISHARITKPAWSAEGYFVPPWGGPPWLFISCIALGRTLALRPSQLVGRSGLFAVVPDTDFWRFNFPDKSGDADWDRAAAYMIKACYAAGECLPPDGVNIRGPGRPRTSGSFHSARKSAKCP